MQTKRRVVANPRPSQPTWTVSPPERKGAATIRIHHRHLLILRPKADTHFTIWQKVEGRVDLGTSVRVCSPKLYIAAAIMINNCLQWDLNLGPFTGRHVTTRSVRPGAGEVAVAVATETCLIWQLCLSCVRFWLSLWRPFLQHTPLLRHTPMLVWLSSAGPVRNPEAQSGRCCGEGRQDLGFVVALGLCRWRYFLTRTVIVWCCHLRYIYTCARAFICRMEPNVGCVVNQLAVSNKYICRQVKWTICIVTVVVTFAVFYEADVFILKACCSNCGTRVPTY